MFMTGMVRAMIINYQLTPELLPGGLTNAVLSAAQAAIQTTMSVVLDRWQSEAQAALRSTRLDYLSGLDINSVIYPYNGDFLSGAIRLYGDKAIAVENGYSAFDQKLGFKNSNKITPTANGGWYLTIPYRHGTPDTTGRVGKPMPKDIYAEAKKLQAGQALSIKGGQLRSWTGYQHKNNVYDGLQRIVKSYNKATQAQYVTFRRVSNNSDPMSWMHPGYDGIHLLDKIKPFAEENFKFNMDRALSTIHDY